jgi:oligosaccharide repeat unit polymerase
MLLRRRQSRWNIVCVLVALFACVLTVTRTPVVDILLIVIVASSLRGRTAVFMLGGALVLVGYLCTQLLFVKDSVDSVDRVLQIAGGALPELRDFGNVLTNPPDSLFGLTFLIGSLPVPGFFSEFTTAYLMRTVTLNAIGIPLTAAHGGLRITYSGEWFINFGIAGVILGGFLLGVFAGWFGRLCSVARAIRDVRLDFLAASLWMMFAFQVYLSGSGVAGMAKVIVFILALFFVPLPRRTSVSLQPQELHTALPIAAE